MHIAPNTLRVASIFAVLTRLEQSKKAGMSLMKKLKLYDGEDVEDFKAEGRQGAAGRGGARGHGRHLAALRHQPPLQRAGARRRHLHQSDRRAARAARRPGAAHRASPASSASSYLNLIAEARKEYDEMAKKEVQRAFVYSFEESAKTLLNNYLDNVEAYCNKTKLHDPITEEEMEPDEQLMRSIEEQIGITENAKKTFREEILIRISSLARRGQTFDYTSHERLQGGDREEALRRPARRGQDHDLDQDARRRAAQAVNEVVNRLVAEHGYCRSAPTSC